MAARAVAAVDQRHGFAGRQNSARAQTQTVVGAAHRSHTNASGARHACGHFNRPTSRGNPARQTPNAASATRRNACSNAPTRAHATRAATQTHAGRQTNGQTQTDGGRSTGADCSTERASSSMKIFASQPKFTQASPFAPQVVPYRVPLWRALLFAIGSALALGLYAWWRPPAPMLWLQTTTHLGRESKQVALTIDDSPHPLTTPLLLAALDHADVKATFFSVGENLKLYPELAHRIVAEGHALANHSQPHHNLTTVAPRDFPAHIDAGFLAINAVEKDAGKTAQSTLFRPPGGGLDREVIAYLYRKNYTLAWWSNNVGDWTCPPAWKIADGVKANLRPGDVLLLHDGGTGTPQALGSIAKDVRARGLEFVLMEQGS